MKSLVLISLFASLTAVSGFVRIPMFPVPFTLQTLMVYLSGGMLGARKAAWSQMVFLLMGLSGVPVFASGGGPGYVLQPTFGYLLGFPAAAWLIGLIREKRSGDFNFYRMCLVNALGMALIHTLGIFYMYSFSSIVLGKPMSFVKILIWGSLIFLPAEVLKIACASGFTVRTKRFAQYFLGVILALLVFQNEAHAQSPTQLNKLRKEIQQLEFELRDKEIKKTTLLEQIENIDREIGLRQRLLLELDRELKKTERAVLDAENKWMNTGESLKRQRDLVLQRMVSIYKRGRISEWEVLLSLQSINQALVWIKYQKRIFENDQRNYRLLQEKEAEEAEQKRKLDEQLNQKLNLAQETEREKNKYEADQVSRKRGLGRLNREKESIQERLREKRAAFQRIEGWITQEENRRIEEEKKKQAPKIPIPKPIIFPKSKPIWPVRGRVVSRYGTQVDAQTGTNTLNYGVDIETQEKSNVQSVLRGQVVRVDWQRGMGNMVLCYHDGWYTVYAHLDAVYVNNGDAIEQGAVIGQVGDRASFYGPLLHFEVWKGRNHCDPTVWLR